MVALFFNKFYHKEGLRCFPVSPGWVKTDMGSENAPLEVDFAMGELLKTIATKIPEGHSVTKLISYDGEVYDF